MKQIYVDYARYNLWANQRLVEVFSSKPEELTEKNIVSSFPSVKLTLLHIWDAELIWLKRLQGISLNQFPSKTFQGEIQQVYEGMLSNSQDFLYFVEKQEEAFFGQTLSFKTISYGEQSQKAGEMIHHCLNHSTFHRGQLVMMARQLGLNEIPPTDLIYFLRG
jgi:uncharacterized damage-inducible protein DinB